MYVPKKMSTKRPQKKPVIRPLLSPLINAVEAVNITRRFGVTPPKSKTRNTVVCSIKERMINMKLNKNRLKFIYQSPYQCAFFLRSSKTSTSFICSKSTAGVIFPDLVRLFESSSMVEI